MSDTSRKVGFVSLGCPKALVDSERILTQLKMDGYDIVPSYEDADVVVVNTCGFIDSAKQESLDAIGEALNENGKVIVTGCMGKDAKEITQVHPDVLAVSGPQAYEEVVGAVHEFVPPSLIHNPHVDLVPPQGVKLTPRHYAYLKISEGCNHKCSFCIIPDLRGKLVSRPIGDVMEEAERLVKAGVRELLVISQDTSAYGVDIKYRTGFWNGRPLKTRMQELCEALGEFGIWVRLHYVYPYPHVDNIIPLMAQGQILPYLDIPFQHGSPRVLKDMKRPAAAENTLERIHTWRSICPDITLRSTFIVGFPGETEEDFEILLDFLDEAQLDRVGCFQYSPVDGARANSLPDHVPAELMQERWERFMETQQAISTAKLQAKVGKTIEILIDEVAEQGSVGRSTADAPEIDGKVYLDGVIDVQAGDFVEAVVESADEYDLWAGPETDPAMNLLLFSPGERVEGNRIRLQDHRLDHLRNVIKASEGDSLRVGEIGGQMGLGRLLELRPDEAILEFELTEQAPAKIPVTLVLALPRPKMLRRILRMVAEFGVAELHLINSYRVEKSYWQSPVLTPDTVAGYFIQGLEQARDTVLPQLFLHKRFKPFVEDDLPGLLSGNRGLVAHPGNYPLCPGTDPGQHTVLVIGPEGGFIPYEIEKLESAGCTAVSLGPRILRVENAVSSLLSRLG